MYECTCVCGMCVCLCFGVCLYISMSVCVRERKREIVWVWEKNYPSSRLRDKITDYKDKSKTRIDRMLEDGEPKLFQFDGEQRLENIGLPLRR